MADALKTITIIGAGMMGSAMSVPASDNGHAVRLVGTHLDRGIIEHARKTHEHPTLRRRLPDSVQYYQIEDVREALLGADAVIGGVSSFGVDWFAEKILPILPEGIPLLMVTKGMLERADGGLETFPHVLKSRAPCPITPNAVGGPCTAYELADRRHSSVCFCGENLSELRALRELLETEYYHVSLSTDVLGVECAVALKNAYALGVTLAVGMTERLGGEGCAQAYNPQAALFGQSVREMRRILALIGGGDVNIVYGAGDLYVTIYGGRTRRLGTLLGRGVPIDEAKQRLSGVTLESVVIAERTVRAIERLSAQGKANLADYPLLLHVGALLRGETDRPIPWKAFETETA